jgi:hypothetical protein
MSNISPERLAAIRHSARRWAEAWRDIRLCREWGLRDPAKWVYHWTGQRYVHRRPERFP